MRLIEKTVLGVMSGTSLDGVDLALVHFEQSKSWTYSVLRTLTVPYPKEWIARLQDSVLLSMEDLAVLDCDYTKYLSEIIQDFLAAQEVQPDFISSHGHTVLHQPAEGITYQIGNLPALAQATGCKVICDFRVADVALKGQGAPLVPGGEVHLYRSYAACVNLGGFANISLLKDSPVVAYDICPVNIVLNALVKPLGLAYDKDGAIARSGKLLPALLAHLDGLAYYKHSPPKSLGIEWVLQEINPLLSAYSHCSTADILHSFCVHFAQQIARELPEKGEVLFSGGGCYNSFLMDLIQAQTKAKIIVPSPEIIEFKEAIVFGFLGVLRELNQNNCLANVTGAQRDHCSGKIFLP